MRKTKPTETEVLRSLAALAQAQRLRAFRALVTAGPEGLTPGVLAEQLDISPSALSFHLKELMHAGLAGSQPDGRRLIYRANFAQMDALLGYLTEHCCQGAACEVSPKRGKKAPCASC
ncbi:MAG: helix-turn-helix transcriptional regulator [Burkholderiales bacterium]|nr:helix-turn-helix transcriptional regulator [Burkholderiales bacterium]